MAIPFTADPSFFASPRLAMQAPPERLAYVAALNVGNGRPDFIAAVDVDPASSQYGQIVGRTELPDGRRRAAPLRLERLLLRPLPLRPPAPRAPLPDRPRPALLAHLRPRHQGQRALAQARQDDRGRRGHPPVGLLAPAHRPLRPRRHLHLRPGRQRRQRRRAGRRHAARPRHLRRARPVGGRPRRSVSRLRLHLAHRPGHRHHQRVGAPPTCTRAASSPSCSWASATATGCTSGTCAGARTWRRSTWATSTR